MSTTTTTSGGRKPTAAATRRAESQLLLDVRPVSLPAATHSYLARALDSLQDALTSPDASGRYAHAHGAALRATAGFLAARALPTVQRKKQRSAWVLLAEVAPEFGEWATFFAAGAAKRAAAEAGATRAVTQREADDLVRDADRFVAVVEYALGLTPHPPVARTPLRAGHSTSAGRHGVGHQTNDGRTERPEHPGSARVTAGQFAGAVVADTGRVA